MFKKIKEFSTIVVLAILILFQSGHLNAQEKFDNQGCIDERRVVISTSADGLSNVIDLAGYKYMSIEMPSSWTTASLTIVGARGYAGTYKDIYYDYNTEVSISVAANRLVVLDTTFLSLLAIRFIKFRSGTSTTPVAQGAERIIYLILSN